MRALPGGVVVGMLLVGCSRPGPASPGDTRTPPPPSPVTAAWDQGAVEWDILWDPHRQAVVARWRVMEGFALVGCASGDDGREPLGLELTSPTVEVLGVEMPPCEKASAPVTGTALVMPRTGEALLQVRRTTQAQTDVEGRVRYQVCASRGCATVRAQPFQLRM